MNKHELLKSLSQTYDLIGMIDASDWPKKFVAQTWEKIKEDIKKHYKEAYAPDQRVVIVFDLNDYKNSATLKNFIVKVQKIINQVDISNFFVVIAHNDHYGHEVLVKSCATASTDLVNLNFVCYDIATDIKTKKTFNPDKSDVFCILPWLHLNVTSYDTIQACCMADQNLGNSKEITLEQAWNNHEMKDLRLSMLHDAYHPTCGKCYELEDRNTLSQRQLRNQQFSRHFDLIEQTQDDGHYPDFNLRYLDIRFSNICNLRCRTCNHHSSSKWYNDEKTLNPSYDKPMIMKAGRYQTDIWDQIKPHLDNVERVYFAGGEPLIMDEHYWILDELEEKQKFDTEIFYNTNFTVIDFKNKNLFDYWSKFTNVIVGASLDASGDRAEYLRKDTKWDTILRNKMLLQEKTPHVKFNISATVSLINLLHLPDFHQEWVEQGLIAVDNFTLNILQQPDYYRVDCGTTQFKQKVYDRYLSHIEWLTKLGASNNIIDSYTAIIQFMMLSDNSQLLPMFRETTSKIDCIRNENILDVFPELNDLF